MYSAASLLLKPIFLHFLSASLHLVLLVAFLVSWVWDKFTASARDGSKEKFRGTLYPRTLLCSLGASAFNLVMVLPYLFYWHRNGWSDGMFATLLDLALKTVAWGIVSSYLFTGFFNSGESSSSELVQYLISDGVSSFVGIFFCYVVCFVKNESEDGTLQKPLLNNNTNVSNALESNEIKGEETVTPYSNAGIFSILTFSWVGPLIAAAKQKTLDLEDVPQLASYDSVGGTFPPFRNKLEADCGTINRVTTLKLVKSLILSAWKEAFTTAILALLNTLASYVGPYLIDTFVQYLNGKETFKNEGYVLVAAFFVAKLVELLSEKHWVFKLRQIGVRIRAQLVTMIYSKSLTLSCQAKQSHTTGEIINFMTVDAERVGNFSWCIHDLRLVVLKVLLALYILYKNLGLASIASFVATVIVMLANVPLGTMQEKIQGKLMESKDRRMKATSEILRNMRILKLQGWEMKFLSKVIELRKTEEG